MEASPHSPSAGRRRHEQAPHHPGSRTARCWLTSTPTGHPSPGLFSTGQAKPPTLLQSHSPPPAAIAEFFEKPLETARGEIALPGVKLRPPVRLTHLSQPLAVRGVKGKIISYRNMSAAPIPLPIFLLYISLFQTRCPGEDAAVESPGSMSHVAASSGTAESPPDQGTAESRAPVGGAPGDAAGCLLLAGATRTRRLCPLAEAPMGAHPAQLPPLVPAPRLPLLPLRMVCTAETITATRNPGTSVFQLSGFY